MVYLYYMVSKNESKRRGRPKKNDSIDKKKEPIEKEEEIILLMNGFDMTSILEPSKVFDESDSDSPSSDNFFTSTKLYQYKESDKNKIYELNERIKILEEQLNEKNLIIQENQYINTFLKRQSYIANLDLYDEQHNKLVPILKTNIACYWCNHTFNNIFCPIVEKKDSIGTMHVFGCYCSFNCAMAQILSLGGYKMHDRITLLKYLYRLIYDEDKEIIPAKDPHCLQLYGNPITIEEYRMSSIINRDEYRYLMPPFHPIHVIIEIAGAQNNDNFTNSNLSKDLILRRTKPLPRAQNSILNIK